MPSSHRSDFTFVVTIGQGSLDYYARKLGERLPVAKLVANIQGTTSEHWNVSFASVVNVRGAFEDARLTARLRRVEGLLHLPSHHFGRFGAALAKPYVITVHDLIRYRDMTRQRPLIHRPTRRDRVYLRLDATGIRRAAAIVAVSQTTKEEIVHHLGLPEARISVVHEGVDPELFRPVEPVSLGYPYVLYVGSEQPRKDLPTLFRAFSRLKRERRFRELRLVKVGGPGGVGEGPFREWTRQAAQEAGVGDVVEFVGHVKESDLASYYSGAECFALASLYEGFGLPPLEAMACGCPVVVSSAGALPETVGEAALLFEPGDDEALARRMAGILTDEGARRELSERGLARAHEFTWERAAQGILRVYDRVG